MADANYNNILLYLPRSVAIERLPSPLPAGCFILCALMAEV